MPNFSGMWTERQLLQARGSNTWPAVPGAPTIGTATATSGTTASVGFTAPSNLGIPAVITGYTVTSSPGGLTGTGASSPITVSGLTTGTAYTFTVTATNATGTGPASAASNSVTPPFTYIEDVFSTWLYTGTGSTQTITNNIDLSTYGGLVWNKVRGSTGNPTYHYWVDTVRGRAYGIGSNSTDAQYTSSSGNDLTSFNSNGYSLGPVQNWSASNTSGSDIVSWTFRKQPKFFDVVTYTGTGANKTVSHNLGSTPGMMIVKSTSTGQWAVYHRSLGATKWMALQENYAVDTWSIVWNNTEPTATDFTVGTFNSASGETYVAYLFAHNAGGFGLTGTDNVISCGSYTGAGTTDVNVNLGYEPQWLLIKNATQTGDWTQIDTMRGMTVNLGVNRIRPNQSFGEATTGDALAKPTATGFTVGGTAAYNWLTESGQTFIYIAIRRGPMKVPTDATKVFQPSVRASGTGAAVSTTGLGFPPDLLVSSERTTGVLFAKGWHDRLRGNVIALSNSTNNEAADSTGVTAYGQDGFSFGTDGGFATVNYSGSNYVYEALRRAPSFFDEVCYAGDNGVYSTQKHNLGVVPELVIAKCRNASFAWQVWASAGNVAASATGFGLNSTAAAAYTNQNFTPYMLATTFTPGLVYDASGNPANVSTNNYVAYLFATCPGVSKVGGYTGTGATQTINCGFAGGARFVLVKRTDSTGDWYFWDTARGMTSGTDPSLLLNSNATEVNANSIYTATTGFQIVSTAAGINASGGSYIFLAIA